jgi:hypothetical protein
MLPITLLALVLSLPAQITFVSPGEGTLGTVLTIDGAGFGTKKPIVKLVDTLTGKSTPLAISEWSDTHVVGKLKKGTPAGARDVTLKPKIKGGLVFVAPGAFTVQAPQPQSVDPAVAGPKEAVTVSGQHFGSKKGKLFIAGKPAKLTAWSDGAIGALVPKKAAGGVVDVRVVNPMGETTLAAGLLVLGAGGMSGPDLLSVTVGGQAYATTGAPAVLALQADGQLVLGGSFGVGPSLQIVLPVDVAGLAVPLAVAGDPAGSVAWRQGAPLVDPAASLWSTAGEGDAYEVKLLALQSGRLVGTFHGTLQRTQGGASPATLELSAGLFVATVPAGP